MNKTQLNKEAIFSQIEKTMVDAFYLYNLEDECYEFMSASSFGITGAHPDFYYSNNDYVSSFVYSNDKAKVNDAYNNIIITKKGQKIDFRIVLDGNIRWVHEEIYPVLNDLGEIIKVSGVISDITDRVRKDKELLKIEENTKLLSEIGLEIGQHLSVRSIVKNIYHRLNDMMDAEFFGIGLINEKDQTLEFPFILEKETEVTTSISLDKNVLATICVHKNETIFLDEYEKDYKKYSDKPLDVMGGDHAESVMYIPLRSKNEIIGVITIQSRKKHAYTQTDLQFLANLSIYVARSLVNANLYESLEKMVEKRTAKVLEQKKELEIEAKNAEHLSIMGSHLASSLKFDEIFENLHKSLSQLLDAECFGVRILDEPNNVINYKFEKESGERFTEISVSLDDHDNYTVWCVKNNKCIHINDNQKDYKNYVKEIKVPDGKMPNSLLFVPIRNNDTILGVITVQSFKYNAYTDKQLNVLKTLAFYTGIALSNANLYETLEVKVTDRTNELAKASKEVMDSINYAKTLQEATLIKHEHFSKMLPTSFVYFKPKNVVSGDFYRVDTLVDNSGNSLVGFLVADCTGHGVPGATLAILCSNIIKQSYYNPDIFAPGDALNFARKSLITLFENSDTPIHDGMDIAFGVLNKDTRVLAFSGAINSCYILRNGELIVHKGNRNHVGYSIKMKPFTTEYIQLEIGDEIYLTTDGYFDQFGGPRYKKFTRKRFVETLKEIIFKSPSEKHDVLMNTFKNWRSDNVQTDDICVFGFTVE